VWPAISHHTDSNLAVLLTVSVVLVWKDRRTNSLLYLAGIFAGITSCIFQHKGLLLLAGIVVWLSIQFKWNFRMRMSILALLAGYSSVFVVVLVYFWQRGALGSLVDANVLWPLQHYETVNVVPYAYGLFQHWQLWMDAAKGSVWMIVPASILLLPYLFVAVLPVIVIVLLITHGSKHVDSVLLLYILCGAAMWISEMHRRDIVHLALASPLLIIVAIALLERVWSQFSKVILQLIAIGSVCLASFNLLLASGAQTVASRVGNVALFKQDRVLDALNRYIAPGSELFIYPYCPSYYFLTQTVNPTPYSVLYNGNDISQFKIAMTRLEERKVRYVLWDTTFEKEVVPANFPNAPKVFIGGLLIKPYLESHYQLITEVEGFRIMERKP
jgi:hypothetical protein